MKKDKNNRILPSAFYHFILTPLPSAMLPLIMWYVMNFRMPFE